MFWKRWQLISRHIWGVRITQPNIKEQAGDVVRGYPKEQPDCVSNPISLWPLLVTPEVPRKARSQKCKNVVQVIQGGKNPTIP